MVTPTLAVKTCTAEVVQSHPDQELPASHPRLLAAYLCAVSTLKSSKPDDLTAPKETPGCKTCCSKVMAGFALAQAAMAFTPKVSY